MKISEFEGCPADSNKFVTGLGLSVYDAKKKAVHNIEINVVNEHQVYIGCGTNDDKENDFGCLGAGSLELVIDGKKETRSVDHAFPDGSGSVLAYNTISSCSRRWYDFDLTPAKDLAHATSRGRGRALRTLSNEEGVFSVIDGMKETAVDQENCDFWTAERKVKGDLLTQTGTWSTIVVKTNTVTLHIEYKQLQEMGEAGCNAHALDVWVKEVSPAAYQEKWEGGTQCMV